MLQKLHENYLPAKQVADLLGYTVQHTRLLIREGKLTATKFGRDWLVGREALKQYLGEQAQLSLETGSSKPRGRQEDRVDEGGAVVWRAGRERYADDDGVISGVNVAQVPQRSPFRYPGGKTWLIPYVRKWLSSRTTPVRELVEPFAGGGIVSLTAVFESLADHATMVELDEDMAAAWQAILNERAAWLIERIATFQPSAESVARVMQERDLSLEHRAFATIVKNRVTRGGILAPGVGLVKRGEQGRGLSSRWYPRTLCRRILGIAERKDHLTFIAGDGMGVLKERANRADCTFFIDPPYTVAAKRLYKHWEVDHEQLFAVVSTLQGDFLMTYDETDEIQALASRYGFAAALIAMKTTHHTTKRELLIARGLDWLTDR